MAIHIEDDIKRIVGQAMRAFEPELEYAKALAMLDMAPERAEAELRLVGHDPKELLREFAVAEKRARTRLARSIVSPWADWREGQHARAIQGASCARSGRRRVDDSALLRAYDETAAAGRGSWSSGDEQPRQAGMADCFGNQPWGTSVLVKVSGSSMEGDHIVDGDVVLVDTRAEPRDGDIVLAHLVGEGQLIKRLRLPSHDRVVLESSNPAYKPIVVLDPTTLTIHGVVRGRAGQL